MTRRRAVLLVSLSAALALLVPGAAQAKSYTLPEAAVQVWVNPDGSLRVREQILFDFFGPFTGAYRDIPLRKGEHVDTIGVSENGRAYRPGAKTDLGSFDTAGSFGVETSSNRVRIVWHYSALDERRVFTITYRFRGLAVAYDDVVDVNMKVWGAHWPVGVSELKAAMALPKPVALANKRYRVWGAPEWVNGVVDRTREASQLRAVNVPAHQFVELRTVFPRRLLTSTAGARVVKGNGLAKIVAEEEHDAADFQHDRDKIQDAKDHIGRTLLTLALLALAPAIAIIFLLWLFFGRERKTDYDREYEQFPPTETPAALVPPLLRQSTYPGSFEFTATLFDLIRRGYYASKPVTTEKSTWGGLRSEQVSDLELSTGKTETELADFEQPVADVFDHILDDGPERLSKMRERIEKTRTSNSKRFTKFKDEVADAVDSRHWYTGHGGRWFLAVTVVFALAATVLLWLGIDGFRAEAPRWTDIVLIALGVCAIVNAIIVVVAAANTKLWRRAEAATASSRRSAGRRSAAI